MDEETKQQLRRLEQMMAELRQQLVGPLRQCRIDVHSLKEWRASIEAKPSTTAPAETTAKTSARRSKR